MLAADILEVPISHHRNRYMLVVMDYFTKWAEAIPLRDQTAASISAAVIKICCSFGVPNIVHSDQGKNFESHLSTKYYQLLAFRRVVLHIIHRGMAWLKDSTAPSSSYCAAMLRQKMIGKNFYQC